MYVHVRPYCTYVASIRPFLFPLRHRQQYHRQFSSYTTNQFQAIKIPHSICYIQSYSCVSASYIYLCTMVYTNMGKIFLKEKRMIIIRMYHTRIHITYILYLYIYDRGNNSIKLISPPLKIIRALFRISVNRDNFNKFPSKETRIKFAPTPNKRAACTMRRCFARVSIYYPLPNHLPS